MLEHRGLPLLQSCPFTDLRKPYGEVYLHAQYPSLFDGFLNPNSVALPLLLSAIHHLSLHFFRDVNRGVQWFEQFEEVSLGQVYERACVTCRGYVLLAPD